MNGRRPADGERAAWGFAVRPGFEEQVARRLAGAAARASGGTATTATFTAAGRIVHVADAADRAGIGVLDGLDGLDGHPPGGAAGAEGVRLDRWAHYAAGQGAGERTARVHRRALLYPVRPGRGGDLCRLLAAGIAPGTPKGLASALVSSAVYARGDVVVRFWEATAPAADELDAMARVVPYSGLGAALGGLLDVDGDLTTEAGFRAFFTGCGMTPVAPEQP